MGGSLKQKLQGVPGESCSSCQARPTDTTGNVILGGQKKLANCRDNVAESLDTRREMIKMIVVLSAAKQAGAVAQSVGSEIWARPQVRNLHGGSVDFLT